MLIRVLLAAIIAGMLAGVFASAVQSYRVSPLILEAERYENADDGGVAHSHSESNGDDANSSAIKMAQEPWAPKDGFERTAYTLMANILVGVGFSLMLTAVVLLSNQMVNFQSGLVWGIAGFVTFVLAPNMGLPPELPGMQAGDLVARQIWWFATVAATGLALWLFAFKRGVIWVLLGLGLMIAPHIYGAPQPISHESLVPAKLAAEFVIATLVASALFWLFLGGVFGALFQYSMKLETNSQTQG